MTYKLLFAQELIPLGFLAIRTDFLWHLVLVFSGVSALCFLFIFHFRNRLSSRGRELATRKGELAPMIQNYLLHQSETPSKEGAESLWMKMELRRLLKNPLDRDVISETMLEVQREALPETRLRISQLYQSFGLHEDAVRQLSGRKWDKISRALSQLTEMQVTQAYDAIRGHVNSKNSIVRKQAQLAIIGLKEEGIGYFLDTCQHPISQWQQVRIIEILTSRPGFSPPSFKRWLVSENQEVVRFALNLVRIFKQYDASEALLMFLNHKSERLQIAALECISEFRYEGARVELVSQFPGASPEIKIHILNALQAIGNMLDIPWLEARAADDTSFMVRSKARLVAEAMQRDIDLVGIGVQGEFDFRDPQPMGESSEIPDAGGVPKAAEGIPQESLFSSEPLLINALKPDFSSSGNPAEGPQELQRKLDGQREGTLTETPSALPAEGWGQEAEQVFGDCIVEELIDVLTLPKHHGKSPDAIPGFLPLVVDQADSGSSLTPGIPSPEWVRQLEVQAESLSGSSGYLGILREILLAELRETAHVLDTEFVPGTGGGTPPEPPGDHGFEDDDLLEDLFPEFHVSPEEIHKADGSQEEPLVRADADQGDGSFSIFEEFFRSYDVESKLILMDEIAIVGGTKELLFLKRLLADPNPKIRKKAQKVHALLARTLEANPETSSLKQPDCLWTPTEKREGPSASIEEEPGGEAFPFSFSLDPDFCFPGDIQQGNKGLRSTGSIQLPPASKLKDPKNDPDA